jgi:hypothetical protein
MRQRYWIYFRGTRNGQHIIATGPAEAKCLFAALYNIAGGVARVAGHY